MHEITPPSHHPLVTTSTLLGSRTNGPTPSRGPERPRRGRLRRITLAAALALAVAACAGDDDAGVSPDGPATYVVDATDFEFDGLPDEIVAGSSIRLVNSADAELHEFVAFRLLDDEERSVAEIVHDDPSALFAGGPPALVILTAPGGEGVVPLGDGTLTEPGRYAIVCMIPTGVDPAEYLEALANSGDGPPDVDGGAPHIAHGMFTEVVVTPAA